MFQVMAPKTFNAILTMHGQGREQKLKLVYRHLTKDEYGKLLDQWKNGEKTTSQVVLELVAEWEADVELDTAGVDLLGQQQPGADFAIINAYGESMAVARRGN